MIAYRNAMEEDMLEVARVHIITQPEYFTTTLGVELLTKFYYEFLKEDNLFIVATDNDTNKIVGFCMGNYYGSQAEKRWEEKYKREIINRLLIKCIQLNGLAISRVIRRIKGIFVKKKKTKPDIYFSHLLSLGVLPEYRGQHIASTMIDKFEGRCREIITTQKSQQLICTIGAYKWNTAGCNLYKYKGYTVYEETKNKLKFMKDIKKK